MSVKNFETSKNTLLEWVRKTTEDKLCIVAQNIFDIASTNKFFSEMYAEIYKVLLEQKEDLDVEIFRNILQKFLTEFTDTMRDIKYVDPANNYDAFCDYNKKNDARRATSLFIINLTKKGVIESSTFLTILRNIFDIVELYMNETGRLNEVEEITENIFLLVSEYIKFLKQEDKKEKDNEWVKLAEQIKVFAGLKAKERASLSSRAIFKYTDLLESM